MLDLSVKRRGNFVRRAARLVTCAEADQVSSSNIVVLVLALPSPRLCLMGVFWDVARVALSIPFAMSFPVHSCWNKTSAVVVIVP